MDGPGRPTVAVVGAGIAGLAAAWEAADAGAHVVLLEADRRAGGKLVTAPFAGRPLDLGPDGFLARRPEATGFVRDVGLGDHLVSPVGSKASLWVGGAVRPLPEGLLLGLPTDLVAVARSGVLSPLGLARAGLDLVLPGEPLAADGPDVAVGAVVRRRLGREVHERLVDPLLGGINAGDSDDLSLRAGVPQLAAALVGQRSLVLGGLRARRRQPVSSSPVFHSVRGGMGRFAEQVARRLVDRGVDVTFGYRASALAAKDGGWSVVAEGGARTQADAVVVALPPGPAAELLEPHAAEAAAALGGMRSSAVAMVCLAYRREDVGHPLDGSGFLVPRTEGRLMTACSWTSSKWPDVAAPGTVVLRVSAGKAGEARAMAMADDDLVRRLHAEVAAALDVRADPTSSLVQRWPDAFPLYRPGHGEVAAAVEAGLPDGLEVAGAAYRGVGVPACIGSGRAAARRAVAAARAATG